MSIQTTVIKKKLLWDLDDFKGIVGSDLNEILQRDKLPFMKQYTSMNLFNLPPSLLNIDNYISGFIARNNIIICLRYSFQRVFSIDYRFEFPVFQHGFNVGKCLC